MSTPANTASHDPTDVNTPERITMPVTPAATPAVTPPTPVLGTPAASGDIHDLLALMARLRADCPWDIKQTNHSLIPYAIEEAYELAEAVLGNDDDELRGELGDVLLQVVFHCQLYAEQGRFDFADVVRTLQQKLIRRHPHVFVNTASDGDGNDSDNGSGNGENAAHNVQAVIQQWDAIKAQEKAEKQAQQQATEPDTSSSKITDTTPVTSLLDGVKAGSALMQAQSLQKLAAKVGFDWDNVIGALDKLEEEIAELKAVLTNDLAGTHPTGNKPTTASMQDIQAKLEADIEAELGDCLFAMVNVARKLKIDAETAALTSVHKFRRRFAHIERQLATQGKTLEQASLAEMDALWDEAKRLERL